MHNGIADSAPCGIVETDARRVVLDVNAVFANWTGQARADLLGRPIDEFVEWEPEAAGSQKRQLPALAFVSGADRWVRPVLVESRETEEGGCVYAFFDATAQRDFANDLQGQQAMTRRTQRRLELVIDSSIAFAGANSETELADVLAYTTAQAFAAEEAVVYLLDERGDFRQAAGLNPFGSLDDLESLTVAARTLTTVVKVSGIEEARALAPSVGRAFESSGVEAMIVAPLHQQDAPLGVLGVFFHHPRQFDDQASPLADALAGQAGRAIANLRLREQLRHAAAHDEVTGLPNRRRLEEHLEGQFRSAHAFIGIVFIDMDGFKQVNDRLGHYTGDELLREVGRRLQASVRADDLVARYGGDEFVVVCEVESESAAAEVAERIRVAIATPYPELHEDLQPTASIGLTVSSAEVLATGADHLLRAADQAMYRAKLAGGDRVIRDSETTSGEWSNDIND